MPAATGMIGTVDFCLLSLNPGNRGWGGSVQLIQTEQGALSRNACSLPKACWRLLALLSQFFLCSSPTWWCCSFLSYEQLGLQTILRNGPCHNLGVASISYVVNVS